MEEERKNEGFKRKTKSNDMDSILELRKENHRLNLEIERQKA